MSREARVLSVEVLEELRAALVRFKQEASAALSSVALVVERMAVWLEQQERFWKQEIRKREQAVSEARLELQRRKLMTTVQGRPPDTTEQEKALRKAQARLQEAEQKLQATKSWMIRWPRVVNEYKSSGQRLGEFLESEMPQLLAWMQGRIEALEAYLALQAPEPPSPTAARDTGSTTSP